MTDMPEEETRAEVQERLFKAMLSADRIVVEKRNALGEFDAQYFPGPQDLDDLARASLAAAYEAAATTATSIVAACNWTEDAERNDVLAEGALAAQSHCAAAIRALTPADARAALDRLLAEEREACAAVALNAHPSDTALEIEPSEYNQGAYDAQIDIAAAIRARGKAATTQEGGE